MAKDKLSTDTKIHRTAHRIVKIVPKIKVNKNKSQNKKELSYS